MHKVINMGRTSQSTMKKIYDNMFRVIKVNSNQLDPAGAKSTEIADLQIPRGFVARIRKVIFTVRFEEGQLPAINGTITERLNKYFMALVNDPDDETSTAIPTHQIDHDVICDAEFHVDRVLAQGATPPAFSGGYAIHSPILIHEFTEDLDIICPRNIRFNAAATIIGATTKTQAIVEVYFTYEKVGEGAILELLNIA